jgi:steroid 5-alpha reductase family enzyme
MTDIFLKSVLAIWIYATAWFGISIIKQRNDVADIAWGPGYILVCVACLFFGESSPRLFLLCALVFIWGMRLASHIYFRNKKKKEDIRYLKWRREWRRFFYIRSYLQVYLLQGFFLLLIVFPVTIVSAFPQPGLNILDIIGTGVWLGGFYFEAVGDFQLTRFAGNPGKRGKVLKTGLWRYSRHPNYFGEVCLWWGIFLIACASPKGLYAVVSPLIITVLILFVSGIPMLEKPYEGDPEYEAYKKITSAFFPRPPKKSPGG